MRKAYVKPQLEICRFDMEEHLACVCIGQEWSKGRFCCHPKHRFLIRTS